ncbi:MAG: hypothetical protein E6I26_01925 [Chloroflexi bacterium]|nr:MAG: hypothetical protein E6I26_01925 [Chloroflexota bacterium]
MTWRDVNVNGEDLDRLIDAYFADEKILAANRTPGPISKEPLPGYDGRLFDWLTEMLNYGPPDGPEQAWPIILQLVARAPDERALTFVGSSALEDLVRKSSIAFHDRIVEEASSNPRFRRALSHVLQTEAVSPDLQELIASIRRSRGQ